MTPFPLIDGVAVSAQHSARAECLSISTDADAARSCRRLSKSWRLWPRFTGLGFASSGESQAAMIDRPDGLGIALATGDALLLCGFATASLTAAGVLLA